MGKFIKNIIVDKYDFDMECILTVVFANNMRTEVEINLWDISIDELVIKLKRLAEQCESFGDLVTTRQANPPYEKSKKTMKGV